MKHLTNRQKEIWYLAERRGWTSTRIALHLGVSKRAVNNIRAECRSVSR